MQLLDLIQKTTLNSKKIITKLNKIETCLRYLTYVFNIFCK